MFKWLRNAGGEVPSRITHIPATASEVYTKGEALKLSATGAWTKASTTDVVAGFANQSKTATASDLTLEVIEARADDVFESNYTGTPAAGFVLGANAVTLAADGLSPNSATVIGGALAIVDINTTKLTCRVRVKSRQLS